MLSRDVRSRLQAASVRENRAWQQVKQPADWEKFRDARLQALRASLGQFPDPPKDLHVRVTRTLEGDGYRIENLVYETRPGLVATANLYSPSKPGRSMPGIVIAHSHHAPNTQGELQDMGMTWARQGCVVLVPEHLGHGERRQHPFRSSKDYARPFRVSRQDYYFRYNSGLQLHLIGDSLMGWMVWDLRRGLDLLLSRPGVDKQRIILLGAVAGGGDPAGVTAALDPRVKAVVPFNFGGPQPDDAIPANAERDFYYFGVGYWESTRCLRLGARDGFAHWLIVGSVAPRGLIYAHEFAWDRARSGLAAAAKDLRLVRGIRRIRSSGRRFRKGQPQREAARKLALQQHRPAAPQQDLSHPQALVRHADPRGVQQATNGGRAALPDAGGDRGVSSAPVARVDSGDRRATRRRSPASPSGSRPRTTTKSTSPELGATAGRRGAES